MMRPALGVMLLAVWTSTLDAQNPPVTIAQRLDTPQARVFVATLQPHAPVVSKSGHATHRVLIYMDDGAMTMTDGGPTSTINFKRGDVRWRPASGPYTAENISERPIRILEIDLKAAPAGPLPVTTLDPGAEVHAQHANKFVFEVDPVVKVVRREGIESMLSLGFSEHRSSTRG